MGQLIALLLGLIRVTSDPFYSMPLLGYPDCHASRLAKFDFRFLDCRQSTTCYNVKIASFNVIGKYNFKHTVKQVRD